MLAAVFPFRSITVGLIPGFYTVFGITMVTSFTLSGLALLWCTRKAHGCGAILSATYLFAAPLVLANVILILEPELTTRILQVQVWLWSLRHIAVPLGIVLSLNPRLEARARTRAGIIAAVCVAAGAGVAAALAFVAINTPQLSTIAVSVSTPRLYVYGAVATFICIVALFRLVRTQQPSALHVVLMIVIVAAMGEMLLAIFSPLRISIGVYASRTLGMVSALFLLTVLTRWIIETVERSDALARYITIAESAPNITFLTDTAGWCAYVNPRWTDLTGQSVEDALGKGFLRHIHPDDVPRRLKSDWFASEGHQLRIESRDGSYIWHLARYHEVRDRARNFMGWVGTATNLDRERRALDESRRLAEELRRETEKERDISTALRAAFLPNVLPHVDGVHFDAIYRPFAATEDVGGDWYDGIVLPDGKVCFTMGDVSGHGLPSAASMLRIREGLRIAALTAASPAEALHFVNRALANAGDLFATALVAFVDPGNGKLQLAVAGHPAPVLIGAKGASILPVQGIVLGAAPDATFENVTTTLASGDKVAFYTDGIIESTKTPIEGQGRLVTELERAFKAGTLGRLDTLVADLLLSGQIDDATIVLLSYDPIAVPTLHSQARRAFA